VYLRDYFFAFPFHFLLYHQFDFFSFFCNSPPSSSPSHFQVMPQMLYYLNAEAGDWEFLESKTLNTQEDADFVHFDWGVLQGVAGRCRVLQGVTGCCRVLQGVAGCCRMLPGVAGC